MKKENLPKNMTIDDLKEWKLHNPAIYKKWKNLITKHNQKRWKQAKREMRLASARISFFKFDKSQLLVRKYILYLEKNYRICYYHYINQEGDLIDNILSLY